MDQEKKKLINQKKKDWFIRNLWFHLINLQDEEKIENFLKKIKRKKTINEVNKNKETALIKLIRTTKNEKLINLLIKNKADINKKDNIGRSPLIYSIIKNQNFEIVELLIKLKANLNEQDFGGISPLMYSAKFSENEKITDFLIKKKCDIKKRDSLGRNAFFYFAKYDFNLKFIKYFFDQKNFFVDERDNNNNTALMQAFRYNENKDIILFFLKSKSDFHLENSKNKNAFYFSFTNVDKNMPYFILQNLKERDIYYNFKFRITYVHYFFLFYQEHSIEVDKIKDLEYFEDKCLFGWNWKMYNYWKNKNGKIDYLKIFVQF